MRMGGDGRKPLRLLAGKPLIAHVLDRAGDGLSPLLLSANDPIAYSALNLTLVHDRRPDFLGPLAGLEAAADILSRDYRNVSHLLVMPGDTPFLPRDLVSRLCDGGLPHLPRVARFAGILQPTSALWPLAALAGLSSFLEEAERHAIRRYLDRTGYEPIDFPPADDAPGNDPFFNVNTPDDLALAEFFVASRMKFAVGRSPG